MGQIVNRALISVSNKEGLVEFAERLASLDIEILSTGGTYKLLNDAGIEATQVSEYTGFPEIMAGRVKTLHPSVHGGILARRGLDEGIMDEHSIRPIDLVVVNLYPFEETITGEACTMDLAIENIDIGGPAMIRSAAKNHKDVWVVCDPGDYDSVFQGLSAAEDQLAFRQTLAAKAFAHTARYDTSISNYLDEDDFPETLNLTFKKFQEMRYGENPHQRAAFYREHQIRPGTVSNFQQIQGKELSFNNMADTDAALECVKAFEDPTCVIVKHGNPCGVATSKSLEEAYQRAFSTDPTSAFGGILAFNRGVDSKTLRCIVNQQFAEVVVAPEFDDEALEIAKSKKNLRVLRTSSLDRSLGGMDLKKVAGGLLLQTADDTSFGNNDLKVVSERAPSDQELADMEFAWVVAWHVKSNAIVYAKHRSTIGVGAGQMSRVVSAKIGILKAEEEGLSVNGSVMASDAFFPFRDSVDAAANAGVSAIIQPGGSVRDQEVIEAANDHNLAMVFTGTRHFRH